MSDDLTAQSIVSDAVVSTPRLDVRTDRPQVTLQVSGFDLIMEGSLLKGGKR